MSKVSKHKQTMSNLTYGFKRIKISGDCRWHYGETHMAVDPGKDENVENIRNKENILIWVDEGIECCFVHMRQRYF
jgi:hypothetical protein